MANQYKNKIIYGNDTLIDLTQDTVTANKIVTGYTAHNAAGAPITGNIPLRNWDSVVQLFDTGGAFCVGVPNGYYEGNYMVTMTPIYLSPPSSGTVWTIVCVPNGTLNPSIDNTGDWIPITIEVDANGNSNVTETIGSANGVSF